jgi:putative ABC transport system permease protein
VSGIAAISLLVSGIGIANTMFMSVMERTREIGIMKAIGAEDKTVMRLFIVESAIFGLVGGVVGALFGFFAAYIVNIFINISISFSMPLAIFALVFSTVTGAVAGWLPARRASKLNVIAALRQE